MVASVLVATHVGTPPTSARTKPGVLDGTLVTVVPPNKTSFVVREVALVPPRDTGSVPVVSPSAIPSDEVPVKVYPAPFPRRSCPYDGVLPSPVPPRDTARVPTHDGVKVCVLPLEVIATLMFASVVVAKV